MNDYKKLTSHHHHRHSLLVDRTYQSNNIPMFKTPSIPLRRLERKKIKSKLEKNHHNYNSKKNCTVDYKEYKSSVVIKNNKLRSSHSILSSSSSSSSSSSKSVNKRKAYKYTHYERQKLIVTPVVGMIYNISKRKLSDELYNPSKRRRYKAGLFKIEPIDETDTLDNLLEVGGDETYHFVDNTVSDQNENSISFRPELNEHEQPVLNNTVSDQNENLISFRPELNVHEQPELEQNICSNNEPSSIDLKSKIEPVKTEVYNFNNDYKLPELKSKAPSPVDYKFNFECLTKIEDVAYPIDSVDVKPSVVVKTESENDDIVRSYEAPLKIYAGQLLWVQFKAFRYWPSIVYETDMDTTTDSIHVIYLADRRQTGVTERKNVFEFDGMNSYLQYRKEMMSKLDKAKWKTALNATTRSKAWVRAVTEGTYLLSVDVDKRLAFVDVFVICSLPNSAKKADYWPALISKHSTPSQLAAVQRLYKENPSICEDVKQKLDEITSEFAHIVTSEAKQQSLTPKLDKPSNQTANRKRRHSEPSRVSQRRHTIRQASIVQSQMTASESASDEALIAENENVQIEQQRKKDNGAKRRKLNEFEETLELYKSTARQKDILFKGLRRGNVCKVCYCADDKRGRDLVKCKGSCGDYVHQQCIETPNGLNEVRCQECSIIGVLKVCYSCRKPCTDAEPKVHCIKKSCGRFYHTKCLNDWLQTKFVESDKVICPSHVCHTCVSDDPRNRHFTSSNSKFSRCIKCPTTYHIDSTCIPAGVKILTTNHHICIRHRIERRKPVSLNWCYICGKKGGTFLCCESCPLTSHQSCLQIPVAGDHYFCDSCETGRHPLYGEIVWAKYSNCKWWPAVVVPPACIPHAVDLQMHTDHDLCVKFFGSYEFGWVGRSLVYLYDEGDAEKSLDGTVKFDKAVQQAENWYSILKVNVKNSRTLAPLPYTKISKITPVPPAKLVRKEGDESQQCACSPDDIDPCGPKSGCANRAFDFECDPDLCPCGDKCNNQCIEKRKYASFRLQYMGDKGFGLIADKFISGGTLIIEYVGELVTEEEFQSRISSKQTQNFYFMKYAKKLYIDAELKGNMSRFMNHSCKPNCQPRVIKVKGIDRIGLFAIDDILEGTELTFNYEYDDGTHKCYCGEYNCRGIIGKKGRAKNG